MDNYFQGQRREFETLLDAKKSNADASSNFERRRKVAARAKAKIELEAMREGLRSVVKQKHFNEWRAAKLQSEVDKNGVKAKLDESEAEKQLDALIIKTYDETVKLVEKEEEDTAR